MTLAVVRLCIARVFVALYCSDLGRSCLHETSRGTQWNKGESTSLTAEAINTISTTIAPMEAERPAYGSLAKLRTTVTKLFDEMLASGF